MQFHRTIGALRNIVPVLLAALSVLLAAAVIEPMLGTAGLHAATRKPAVAKKRSSGGPKNARPSKAAASKAQPAKKGAAGRKAAAAKKAPPDRKSTAAKKAGGSKKVAAAKHTSGSKKNAHEPAAHREVVRAATRAHARPAERNAPTARSQTPRVVPSGTQPETAQRPAPLALAQQVLPDSSRVVELADGISHRWMITKAQQVVNVIAIDLRSGARLSSYKALDRYDGLENALDIGTRADEQRHDTVYASTNASFWRAGSNTPIGPTITNGEVLEMPGYKLWSSLMIFNDGTAAIERITLEGEVFWKARHFQVAAVNHRGTAQGIVVYNHHYGDSVPLGSRKSDSAIIAETSANRVVSESGDETEASGLDTAGLVRSYRESKLLEDKEHPMLKIACEPVRSRRKRDPLPGPVVGDTMRLVVTAIDTGAVAVPENGYVLSLGFQAEWFSVAEVGDTINLLYTISPKPAKRVREVLTGTPRLVRDGTADPEYEVEGSRAKRFIDGKLARTAVGISKEGDTLFLATVNSGCTCTETSGMSLAQLAEFMRSIGSWQAINFDGGGSASMAVSGMMISRQGSRPSSRRVSNALMAIRPFRVKKEVRTVRAID